MFRSYITIAIRNLLKNKLYTLINIFGLSLGLSAFLLLTTYIDCEKSYERHLNDVENIYRLTTIQVVDGEVKIRDAMTFYPAGAALSSELPEIIAYTSSLKFEPLIVRNKEDLFDEKRVLGVDRYFLKIFNYRILSGDTSKMAEPNQLILTKSKAIEYFGREDVVGESLFIHSGIERSFNIAAVVDDVPRNTHYKFDILMSISTIQERLDSEPWSAYMYYSYVRLKPGVDIEKMKPILSSLSKKYLGEKTTLVFNLQPILDIHLSTDFTFEPEINGSKEALQNLLIIAFFILLVAWVNYVNLSTAKSLDRAKEIGIRKVVGANRSQLIWQFFLESVIVNLLGVIVTYLLIILSFAQINELFGVSIPDEAWNDLEIIKKLVLWFIIGTFVTGSYPAIFLSASNPITILKGNYRTSKSGILMRKGLVAFQFITSIVLITGMLIVTKQIQFMQSRDKGINTAQVLGLALPAQRVDSWQASLERLDKLAHDLNQHESILSIAVISNLPGGGNSDINASSGIQIIGVSEYNEGIFYSVGIDDNVIPLLNMEILFGRNFNRELPSDKGSVIVNETFLKKLSIQANDKMIGQRIKFGRKSDSPTYEIVGIVKDSNRTSLAKEIEPTIYFFDWGYGGGHGYGNMMIKCNELYLAQAIQTIQKKWTEFFPNEIFRYEFLDERFARLYFEDQRFSNLFKYFSILAILITMMGLFGLSYFMGTQRVKEVGVRMVLGATVPSILYIFFSDVLKLILFSSITGIPIVVLTMTRWLEKYAYRIDFPVWTLIVSLLILVSLSFLTISYQTLKVALSNPIKSLRSE